MNIIYIFTLIVLFISYLLVYKKEEKSNLLFSIVINSILLIGYNIVICTVMYFISIKSTLLNLSICNLIFSIIPIVNIIKSKKIQKYYIKLIDVIAFIIIIALAFTVIFANYGFPIKIKHAVTDATTHFFAADDFYRYSTLLPRENSDKINWIGISHIMTGAYINNGIFLKLFDGIISETYFCQLYFLFDILIWVLSGFLMYTLLAINSKKVKHKILALVFSVFYILAYQLNSLFAGFSYLGVGLDVIIGILIIMKSDMPKLYKRIGLFLLNFGIMFSYYYFAPVIFIAVLWQIVNDNKASGKKFINLEIILDILITLFIPGLIGLIYFIILPIFQTTTGPINYFTAIGTEGFIYENLFTNILPYLLFAEIYLIYNFIKKKDVFNDKLLFLNIIFMIIIYIGLKLNIVSDYYFYKIYYMFFIVLISSSFEIIKLMTEKKKKINIIIYLLITIYAIGIFIAIVFEKNFYVYDIYMNNGIEIHKKYEMVTGAELEILDYYNKNINNPDETEKSTYFCKTQGNNGRDRWIYSILKNPNNFIDAYTAELTENLDKFMQDSTKYMVVFKTDYAGDYDKLVNEDVKKYNLKILIQNESGMILQKQN